MILISIIILLSALWVIWTDKGLMIHDFIAKSFAEEGNEQKYRAEKKQTLIALAILIIAKVFVVCEDNQKMIL